MKTYLSSILILCIFFSCNPNGSEKTEREGEPDIYHVANEDKDMNEAIEKANQTFDDFKKSLAAENPDYSLFAIKTRYQTANGGEHIWLADVTTKDGNYYGVVDNLPQSTTGIKQGDTVLVDTSNISDWMYVDQGKLRGGYTIRVLRNRMSAKEKKAFDEEYGLIIEE